VNRITKFTGYPQIQSAFYASDPKLSRAAAITEERN
jgi:hypothetical protein